MDALEFLKERSRMCKSYKTCIGCPLKEAKCTLGSNTSAGEYEKIIAAVEQWSKEHPLKTRQSVFLKQWPNAARDRDGVMNVCPRLLDVDISCADAKTGLCRTCDDCRREFWSQEAER